MFYSNTVPYNQKLHVSDEVDHHNAINTTFGKKCNV